MRVKGQIKGALETATKTKACLLDVQRRDKRGQGVDNGRWRRGLVHQDGGGSWTTLNHWSIKMEEDSCRNCRTPWPLVHLVQAWPTPRSLRTLHHVSNPPAIEYALVEFVNFLFAFNNCKILHSFGFRVDSLRPNATGLSIKSFAQAALKHSVLKMSLLIKETKTTSWLTIKKWKILK